MHFILHTLCTPLSIHQYYVTNMPPATEYCYPAIINATINNWPEKANHDNNNLQCSKSMINYRMTVFYDPIFIGFPGFSGSESGSVNKRNDPFLPLMTGSGTREETQHTSVMSQRSGPPSQKGNGRQQKICGSGTTFFGSKAKWINKLKTIKDTATI